MAGVILKKKLLFLKQQLFYFQIKVLIPDDLQHCFIRQLQ